MTKPQRKHRIFIDASVLVAGFLSATGGSRNLCRMSQESQIHTLTAANVVDETVQAIRRYTEKQQDEAILVFLQEHKVVIHEYILERDSDEYSSIVDPLDAHVIAGALMTQCSHLVSLNKKHLVRPDIQKNFADDLLIVTPGELLRLLG